MGNRNSALDAGIDSAKARLAKVMGLKVRDWNKVVVVVDGWCLLFVVRSLIQSNFSHLFLLSYA